MLYVVTSSIDSEMFATDLLKAVGAPKDIEFQHIVGVDSYTKKGYLAPVIKITGVSLDGIGIRLGYDVRLASLDPALVNEEGNSYRMKRYNKFQHIKLGDEKLLLPKFQPVYSKKTWELMHAPMAANAHLETICDKSTGMRPDWNLEGIDWNNPNERPVEFGLFLNPNRACGYVVKTGEVKTSQHGNTYLETGGIVALGMEVHRSSEMAEGKSLKLNVKVGAELAAKYGYADE